MRDNMKIAIDLTWVKPMHNGGIEAYIRNLLYGFSCLNNLNEYYLFCAKDNEKSFAEYKKYKRFYIIICNINAFDVTKRIIWHNINFNKIILKHHIHNCFMPVYCKPLSKNKKIKYVTTIHDLQQLHYPEYFSKKRIAWIKFAWKRTIYTSDCIVAISDYVNKDICNHFNTKYTEIRTIQNPIVIDDGFADFDQLSLKYNISKNNFIFIISSMLKHKNIMTALKVIEKIKKNKINLPCKLVLAGIREADENRIVQFIQEHSLQKECVLAGFISNQERNTLYKNCYAFLFPSIYEGFGMPVVEALMLGAKVITTKCTSIPEVSKERAVYVNNPFDVNEWIDKLSYVKDLQNITYKFPEYDKTLVAQKYINIFNEFFVK